jgi:hypothetical protein
MATRVPSRWASVQCATRAFSLVDASALFLSLLARGPPSVRVSEAFTTGPVPAFLSEIKGHGGQYVWRSSRVMLPKVSWARGLRPTPPSISMVLDARDGAEGGLQCKASGSHPQQ